MLAEQEIGPKQRNKGRYRVKDVSFPPRLKRLRIQQGLTVYDLARGCSHSPHTIQAWCSGTTTPYLENMPRLAKTLGLPLAQLFTDELVLAEIRVSQDTLERIRKGGRQACQDVAQTLATQLEYRLWEEATRPEVDMSPGARPKPRRSRAEVLAGINQQAKQRRAEKRSEQAIT